MKKFGICLVTILITLPVGVVAARPVSEKEALSVAKVFVSAIYGRNSNGSCWPYENLKHEPGVFMCEQVLEDHSSVTLIVGAKTEMPPVLLYYRGRPLDITSAEPAKKAAEQALDAKEVHQIASVYYSPLDFWFEYQAGAKRVMVSPYDFRVYDPKLVRDAKPIAYADELVAQFEQEWNKYFSGKVLFGTDDDHHWISGVADWDWHYGCAPTAAANVLTYWSNNGYPLLVDSVMHDVWDHFEHDSDDVPNVSRQLAKTMNTDTVNTGGTLVDSVAPGIMEVCNAPFWGNNYSFNSYLVGENLDTLISEINNDRPGVLGLIGHPKYHDHAVTYCGWGPPNTNWIMIHDEWSSTPPDTVIYYWYGAGPRLVIPVIPGGASNPDIGVTSIVQPEDAIPPGIMNPQADVSNFGNSADSCLVFCRIERPGGGFYESFTDSVFPPLGWHEFHPDSGIYNWYRGTAYPYSLPGCATCQREASLLPNDDWLVTPKVRVRERDTLLFWFRSLSTFQETLQIWVSYTDSSPSSFQNIIQMFHFNNQGYQPGWADFHTIGDTMVYIGFRYISRGMSGVGVCLDDIQLTTVLYTDTVKTQVDPGQSQLVSFRTWNATEGHYVARCSTYQSGDVNPNNDVKTKPFLVTHTLIPPSNWTELKPMPAPPSYKDVKRGGSITYMPRQGLIYATKGYKTGDYYSYNPVQNSWIQLLQVPKGPSGRLPRKGARLTADGKRYVYLVKGNNTQEFWRYDTDSIAWTQKADVPLGPSNKKVKGGTDLAYVKGNPDYIYLLKGYRSEFYRYNVATDTWVQLADAPNGCKPRWKRGSWLVFDGSHTIYAHKSTYYVKSAPDPHHEMWKYDIALQAWLGHDTLNGMPLWGMHGSRLRKKKSKDGGCAAWYDGCIYALKGGNTQQFFRYTPGTDQWDELDTVPTHGSSGRKKRVKYGADIVNIGNAFYALKGNKTRELWRYAVPAGFDVPDPTRAQGPATLRNDKVIALQIAPNPFADGFITLSYTLPKAGFVNISIYNIAGQVVARKTVAAGLRGTQMLELRGLSAGVYLLRLEAVGLVANRKLVVQD